MIWEGFSQGEDPRGDFTAIENAAQLGVVLLPSEEMKSGLGLLTKPLGPVVARSDFEVEAADFPTVVLVLDAQVGDGNLAVHDLEVKLVRDEDSLVPRVFVGPHPGEGFVEVFLQFEVKDDAADLPA